MSRKTTSKALIAAALLLAAAAGAPADTFSFSSDSTTMRTAEGNQHALLTGHARVETADLRITADQIELFGKDFIYAQCNGNVHVVDAKRGLDLTAETLFYDRDRKIARVRGNAVMADLKNEMTVKAGFIEDRDTDQIDIIQIGVRIFKKDIVCRAEFARYLRDKKILELSGMPWVSKGSDTYQATRITINLDTEEISLEGDVSGSIVDKGSDKGATPPADQTGKQPDGNVPAQGSGAAPGTQPPVTAPVPQPQDQGAGATPPAGGGSGGG